MIDTTLVAFGYAFVVFAALVASAAVAAVVVALRDSGRTTTAHDLVTVAGPAERELSRAA
ncbi:hypothetical protein [Nocardioides sp. URHA0020]|uniref:hypothetical protein n=1 Tax=Nocardioides sp. URHA0020 TaxID=1380392 RepID=UPI000491BA51|nr:hypothetical protein [Nocardioides sp. URHA0020]